MVPNIYDEICQNCGGFRSNNQREGCRDCGSRIVPLLGYVYPHEAQAFWATIAILLLIVILALAIGLAYLYYTSVILGV